MEFITPAIAVSGGGLSLLIVVMPRPRYNPVRSFSSYLMRTL
jgi:hypothetical protein